MPVDSRRLLLLCSSHYPVGRVCVCVCVFSSHSFWTSSSLDVPAGVTQEEGHKGFLIHLLSAVRALIFLAKRNQPFLSLVNYCPPVGHFCFVLFFSFFSEKNPVCRGRTHVPTCQRGYEVPLSYRGDRHRAYPVIYVVANPVRGLLDRKRSGAKIRGTSTKLQREHENKNKT